MRERRLDLGSLTWNRMELLGGDQSNSAMRGFPSDEIRQHSRHDTGSMGAEYTMTLSKSDGRVVWLISCLAALFMSVLILPQSAATTASAQSAPARPLKILLLGDSYTAGNGASAFNSDPGDDLEVARYYGGSCYRSHLNWGSRYAARLRTQGYNVTIVNRACNGATTAEVLNSQISEVSADYDLVLLTIGGNDLGFRGIVEQCFIPGERDPGSCRTHVDSARTELRTNYRSHLRQILNRIGGVIGADGKIVLVSYPHLERDPSYTLRSRLGLPGGDRYAAGLEIRNLATEGDAVQREVVTEYNSDRGGSAEAVFVDNTKDRFGGHEPHGDVNNRGADRWIFSYLDTGDLNEWYHPNPTGHGQWAELVSQYGDFSTSGPIDPGAGGAIDMVFTIDTTGSMGGEIAAVRDNLNRILSTLESRTTGFRVALVTYKDDPATGGGPGDYRSRVEVNFTSDVAALRAGVNSLGADGGGDTPETVYSGLMSSIGLSWRAGVKKVVLVLGDAPPKDPEPGTGFTAQSVTDAAIAVDPASVYGIDAGGLGPAVSQIAASTGGRIIPVGSSSEVDDAVDEIIEDAASRPYAWLDGPHVLRVGDSLQLDASGSYGIASPIVSYDWDFDADGTYDETTVGPLVTHQFNDLQDALTAVRVTDAAGLSAVANTQVLVTDDGDEVPASDDNCPDVPSPDQSDEDGDGIGNPCDPTPGFPTQDLPGVSIDDGTPPPPPPPPSPEPTPDNTLRIKKRTAGDVPDEATFNIRLRCFAPSGDRYEQTLDLHGGQAVEVDVPADHPRCAVHETDNGDATSTTYNANSTTAVAVSRPRSGRVQFGDAGGQRARVIVTNRFSGP